MAQSDGKSTPNYESWGEVSHLPENYSVEDGQLPQWRIALFTLTYAIPENELPDELQNAEFFDEGALREAGFGRGRAQGIRQLSMPYKCGETGLWINPPDEEGVRKEGCREGVSEFMPKALYESARRRYNGILEETLGAVAADEDIIHEEIVGASHASKQAKKQSLEEARQCARFYNITYSRTERAADVAWQLYGLKARGANAPSSERVTREEAMQARDGSLRVVSLELAEFKDPGTDSGDIFNRFIVVTLALENASDLVLESTSQALQRRRNYLWTDSGDSDSAADLVELIEYRVLDKVSNEIECALSDAVNPQGVESGDNLRATINRSNVITLNSASRCPNAQFPVMPTLRSVVVVPNGEVKNYPPLATEGYANSDECEIPWPKETVWAWALASGADNFVAGTPDFTSAPKPTVPTHPYLHWRSWVDEHGFALVRRDHPDNGDFKFFVLAPTRFTDLVMLVMRSHVVLTALGVQLRELRFTSVNQRTQGKEIGKKELEELTAEMSEFREVQADFVRFRDRIWRNSVAKYEADTRVLRGMRTATGAEDMYEDFVDELDTRQEVYSSLYSGHRLNLEAQEQEERDRAARKGEEVQVWLAVFAVVLAIPGLVALESWLKFGLSVTLIMISLLLLLFLKWFNNRKE